MPRGRRSRRERQGARDLRARPGAPAARRERPHLRLRRHPPDRDPGQGARPDRPVRLLVRPHARDLRRTTCSALRPDGRSTECRRLRMLPIECVVRGYLAGSGWKDYQRTGATSGHALPAGTARVADRLPEPIFTPGDEGADGPRREHLEGAGRRSSSAPTLLAEVERALDRPLLVRRRARGRPAGSSSPTRSSSSGSDEHGPPRPRRRGDDARLARGSGRPTSTSRGARSRRSTSSTSATTRRALGLGQDLPGPELPDEVVAGTRARYVEAFERITGHLVRRLPRRPGGVGRCAMRATVLVRPKAGILDPQGEAVRGGLDHLGFKVREARVGRLIDLELDAPSADGRASRGRGDVREPARQPADRELSRSRRSETAARVIAWDELSDLARRIAVVVFPGSNDDGTPRSRSSASAPRPCLVWHGERGAPRRRRRRAARRLLLRRLPPLRRDRPLLARDGRGSRVRRGGGPVLGICNGFQILCEAGLLPGVLLRNRSLRFVCRDVALRVERAAPRSRRAASPASGS